MKQALFPLISAAALALPIFSSFSADQLPASDRSHFVAYQQDDADANAGPEDNSAGSYDVFYDGLATQGRWFNDDNYGYVWQPQVAESTSDWRPYADGHWVWTDRGWYWNSNEDFGWATYHYGRWIMVAGTGWVWVPGDQWAPGWVSWRQTDNDDYVGWAPLPPEASFSVNVGVHPWCDSYYDIGPAAFAFVRIGDFGRPSYRGFFAPAQQNLNLINRTTNVTNITYNNNAIYNNGPQYQRVSQLVQQREGLQIPNYKLNYAAQTHPNSTFKTAVQGNQLNVLAPPQKLRPVATAGPRDAKPIGKGQVERGWQNVPQAQAQQLRHQFVQQAPVPQSLPAKPVLTGKPQIQAVTKGEPQRPGEPPKAVPGPNGNVQQGNEKLQPFIEKPGNKAATVPQNPAQRNLEMEKAQKEKGQIETGQPAHPKSVEPPAKPAVITEQPKAPPEPAKGLPSEKAQTEHHQPPANAPHPSEKQAVHEESPKARKQEPKKEPPVPAQTQKSQPSPHAVAHQAPPVHHTQQSPSHVAQASHVQQPPPHVAQAPHPQQPHPPHVAQPAHPQQPHRTANNNEKKKKPE
jgi:hypothetical protein